MDVKVEDLVKEAVDHLLEAELLEVNGWTKEHIKLLKKLSSKDFDVIFKESADTTDKTNIS
ncbi:hypothetical protein [Paenibacillus cremeus]|uniref:Uncharacterized protein n=1 Tax=Paenibacillus cremeus TaxID=2163881 RepID=A0A559KCP2_9BACL|nr:hypothetical protein [Paenibacillus cremeus]TVY09890.1 hypothetical protein FPZ49_10990 [Paenibacillus cremeus]